MTIRELQEQAHATAVEKGWYDGATERNPLELIALVHSELSEAVEEARQNNYLGAFKGPASDKPIGFVVELADAVIRIADMCGHLGLDLEGAIEAKLEFNKSRPRRHGGKLY